jgi:hypothetical protein
MTTYRLIHSMAGQSTFCSQWNKWMVQAGQPLKPGTAWRHRLISMVTDTDARGPCVRCRVAVSTGVMRYLERQCRITWAKFNHHSAHSAKWLARYCNDTCRGVHSWSVNNDFVVWVSLYIVFSLHDKGSDCKSN